MNFKTAFRRLQGLPGSLRDTLLDVSDRSFCLSLIAVRDKPARAFWDVASQKQDAEAEEAANGEAKTPTEVGRDQARIEEQQRGTGARHCSKPEAAIHDEVNATPMSRWNQFINGRIDGRVLTADTQAGDGAKRREAQEAPGHGGQKHPGEIDDQSDVKNEPATEAVRHPAEQQRADYRPNHIAGCCVSNLYGGEPQSLRVFQHGPDRSHDRDLEAVEDPCDAERDDHEQVETTQRKPVKPCRDVSVKSFTAGSTACLRGRGRVRA